MLWQAAPGLLELQDARQGQAGMEARNPLFSLAICLCEEAVFITA